MATILCVDDEPASLLNLRTSLDQCGHRCVAVTNLDAAFNVLSRGPVDLVIADCRMTGAPGSEFLTRLAGSGYDVPVVMTADAGAMECAAAAVRAGAVDAIMKPVLPDQLGAVVEQALEFSRLRRENAALRQELRQLRSDRRIIGESPALLRIMELVRTVAPTRAAVLLHGESGTGKELLARTVHDLSDRSELPFVAVDCAALPAGLAESTLFGADADPVPAGGRLARGALERAHRGTLLLHHVSNLQPDLQARLLRVLQEQEIERPGGAAVRVDLRIVSTTTVDLAEETRQGRFREDLFFRLGAVPVHIPPLRSRPEDLPLLARYFAARTAREMGRPFTGFTAGALSRLRACAWPGNVRELAHAVERAVILSRSGTLDEDAFDGLFPAALATPREPAAAGVEHARNGAIPLVVLNTLDIGRAEAALIARALEVTRNNRTRAAELLGISVRTLRNKLNRELTGRND